MKVSRRETQRMRLRIKYLEGVLTAQRERFAQDWPASITIGNLTVDDVTMARVRTARALEHAVVVVPEGPATLRFFASKIPD